LAEADVLFIDALANEELLSFFAQKSIKDICWKKKEVSCVFSR
jgi:siroheme synthase